MPSRGSSPAGGSPRPERRGLRARCLAAPGRAGSGDPAAARPRELPRGGRRATGRRTTGPPCARSASGRPGRSTPRWPTCAAREAGSRPVPTSPGDIDFHAVEAAILLHFEAGLVALQALSPVETEAHFGASAALLEWSRDAAGRQRRRGLVIAERIDRRDYYFALASAVLAIGFPPTARPFAEAAQRVAPLDPEVRLVFGCVAEGIAEEAFLRHRESGGWPGGVRRASGRFGTCSPSTTALQEARLHLGRLHLDRGRLIEAEPLLAEVEARSADDPPALPRPSLPRPPGRAARAAATRRPPSTGARSWPGPTARPHDSPSGTPSRGRPAPRPPGRWSRRAWTRLGASTAPPIPGGSTPSARRAWPRPPSIASGAGPSTGERPPRFRPARRRGPAAAAGLLAPRWASSGSRSSSRGRARPSGAWARPTSRSGTTGASRSSSPCSRRRLRSTRCSSST